MASATVVLIQPDITYPEQISGRHQLVRQREQYIEVGLLSIASHLRAHGLQVTLVNMSSGRSLQDLREDIVGMQPRLVGIACMSGFAYPALKTYCSLAKSIDKKIFTFTGGQHAGPLNLVALKEIPDLDCVVRHEGEGSTLALCDVVVHHIGTLASIPGISFRLDGNLISSHGQGTQVPLDEIADLDYEMFPGFLGFVPRLEESRGCPFDCSFCSNASTFTFRVRYKSVDRLIRELQSIYHQYKEPDVLRFYLIAKNYGLDRDLTLEFAKSVRSLPFRVEWRTQTRGDIIDPDIVHTLSDSGLRVLDLGLETASPRMVRLINKAANPEQYLKKTEAVFEAVAKLPKTKLKINLVFHPGETAETLAETLAFLFKWREKIDAVTAAPVMVDPGAPLWNNLAFFETHFGTRRIINAFWDSLHTYPVNPSADLTFEQSNVMANLIAKMFQSKEAYFETRLFGGWPRGSDVGQFSAAMEGIPSQLRPYTEPSC